MNTSRRGFIATILALCSRLLPGRQVLPTATIPPGEGVNAFTRRMFREGGFRPLKLPEEKDQDLVQARYNFADVKFIGKLYRVGGDGGSGLLGGKS